MVKEIEILYEDNHIIVVNKPAGLLVQADRTEDECLLDIVKDFIKRDKNKPGDVFLGCVHRIDRPVSGAVMFAKTSKALERLNRLFQNKEINKTYFALVDQLPENFSGNLVHYIRKDKEHNKVKATINETKLSKRSELNYEFVASIDKKHLLKIKPITGRAHQIRVQLKMINCPIIGDLKYGSEFKVKNRFICLHCTEMKFIHPVTKLPLVVRAPLPRNEFWWDFREQVKIHLEN